MFSSLAAIASHCSPPPKVENAVVMTPYQKEYLSDSKVTYECRDRYMMEEEQTLQCKDGKWEEKNIKCTRTYAQRHSPTWHWEICSKCGKENTVDFGIFTSSHYWMEWDFRFTCLQAHMWGRVRTGFSMHSQGKDVLERNRLIHNAAKTWIQWNTWKVSCVIPGKPSCSLGVMFILLICCGCIIPATPHLASTSGTHHVPWLKPRSFPYCCLNRNTHHTQHVNPECGVEVLRQICTTNLHYPWGGFGRQYIYFLYFQCTVTGSRMRGRQWPSSRIKKDIWRAMS